MALLDFFFRDFRPQKTPTKTIGMPGTAVFGGFVDEGEKNADLQGQKRYITYSNLLANTSIVAASVRYALNLIGKADWIVEPVDDSAEAVRIAEWFEQELFSAMDTPWHRVVRRTASYRFYGFSIQEWTAIRREDGSLGIKSVEPRPQHTIWLWVLDKQGKVEGVVQRPPQDYIERDLPRAKLVYAVDDSLSDSPEGLGLFRHVVEAVNRLAEYEKLEGIGFESDLRGIPIGRAPVQELNKMVKQGVLSKEQADQQLLALRTFLTSHKKSANLAMLLDSSVFESKGDNKTPSGQQQWNLELLSTNATSAPELAQAIQRLNREVARVLGTESILLGESGAGSLAMAKDKSDQFAMVIDSTTKELAETFEADLIMPFMKLNGWDPELAPTLKPSKIQHRTVEEITAALRDLAASGAMLAPDDEAINSIRKLLGLPEVDLEQLAEDAALMSQSPLNAEPEIEQEEAEEEDAESIPEEETEAEETGQG